MKQLPSLYAIADASFGDPVEVAARLFRGGARLVQIRNKEASSGEFLNQTATIVRAAPDGASVIVNDRADIARICGAAGVHLGQDDLPPAQARVMLGERCVLGVSTHDAGQALEAVTQPIDYVAVGPVFSTATKKNPAPPLGLDGLAEICRRIDRPVVAIGGIRLENVEDVIASGASSIAVISDLIGHEDIEGRTRQFLDKLDRTKSV